MNKEPKKRGRKPKGGKIITPSEKNKTCSVIQKPNIILHLKCNSKNLLNNKLISNTNYNPNIESISVLNLPICQSVKITPSAFCSHPPNI